MKNTTVLLVGVGLVGGLTALALVAGRGAPSPEASEPPNAPAPLPPTAVPSLPPPPPPGTVMGQLPPGAAIPQPPPGAVMMGGPPPGGEGMDGPPPGAVVSKEPTAMRPGMTRSKGGMRVPAASTMAVPGAADLPREEATAGMQTVLSGVAPCFEALAKKVDQDVNATLSLEFWGGKEGGTVRSPDLSSLTPDDATTRSCVMKFLEGAKFRAPTDGAMRMNIPLVFSMRDDLFGGGPPPGAMRMGGPPPGAMPRPPPQGY